MMVKQQMASMSGIVIPTVYAELVSRKVMVTEWVDGDKLSNCKPSEIKALCGTFLNCFLVQLMETGLLHADPHPGNLMRTHDGKLVILDFGLMTEIKPEHRIALVEFITHLSMDDWELWQHCAPAPGSEHELPALHPPLLHQHHAFLLHH
jgi:aarF domain-containing kinase